MLNDRGHEIPDPTPVARPVRWTPPESLVDQIRRFVRQEFSQRAAEQGFETFQEADDFDVDGDVDPSSRWELSADQEAFELEHPSGGPGAEPPGGEPAPTSTGGPPGAGQAAGGAAPVESPPPPRTIP